MKRKSALPELLAPAGDMQALLAAVEAGADAVYVGGARFGARAYAKNFSDEELAAAVKYCHLHGVRLYVTVNTMIFDREMRELSDYAAYLWEIGTDALIVSDLGAIKAIRARVPELELHASTQMSVHNTEGAVAAASLGCVRVVLARELERGDIYKITEECPAETEVFLHGALCVSHSGQCLFSSMVGGRSGNRGECAQPCRLPYSGGYPLSMTDLSLADHVTELIESGTASLKIEGRMKSPDYVFAVTSVYRRLLDGGRNATEGEREELRRIFSRGGFSDGYFTGKHGARMTAVRSEEDKSATRQMSGRAFQPIKKAVRASAAFRIGEPCVMTLTDGERSVSVRGELVREAISAPLTAADLRARLSKTGNTFLSLSEGDIEIELDGGAYLSPKEVNSLRRAATDAFEDQSRSHAREYTECGTAAVKSDFRTALFLRTDALSELEEKELSDFDATFAPLFSDDGVFKLVNGAYIPPVLRNSDMDKVRARLSELKMAGVRYALIGNIGAIRLCTECGLEAVGDMRLNTANKYTRDVLFGLGLKHMILSAEVDLPKARDIGGAVTVYGRIPLMLTERCFIKENFSCARCSDAALTDRRGKKFPIMREYGHRNLILNSEITYMADRMREVHALGLSEHFIFSKESEREIRAVLRAFKSGAPMSSVIPGEGFRRIGMREAKKDKKA